MVQRAGRAVRVIKASIIQTEDKLRSHEHEVSQGQRKTHPRPWPHMYARTVLDCIPCLKMRTKMKMIAATNYKSNVGFRGALC